MSRDTHAKCRLCRAEGTKLFLKGERCFTAKCAVTRRDSLPGVHTWRRGKPSPYAGQLREKQKVKRYYSMRERPFRRFFGLAERAAGNTGEALLTLLESKLDNVLYLAKFAASRAEARQMIAHGRFMVNGRRVNVASFLCSQDDVIAPVSTEKIIKRIAENIEIMGRIRETPAWLEVSDKPLQVTVRTLPGRDDISVETREQLVVELLSK